MIVLSHMAISYMNGFAPEIQPWCDRKFQKTLNLVIQQLQQVFNNVKTRGS